MNRRRVGAAFVGVAATGVLLISGPAASADTGCVAGIGALSCHVNFEVPGSKDVATGNADSGNSGITDHRNGEPPPAHPGSKASAQNGHGNGLVLALSCPIPVGDTGPMDLTKCQNPDQEGPAPQPTAAMVLQELKRITLPQGRISFQPSWGGLVNKAEIFYTTVPRERDQTITLLGQSVDVHMRINSYHWQFGDGGSMVTTTPGAPYPSRDITHTYRKSGSYQLMLSLSYGATFRTAGGPAQPIDGEVTVTGPAVTLSIVSAHSELVGN